MYLIEPIRDGQWVYDLGTILSLHAYVRDEIFLDDDIIIPYLVNPAVQIGLNQNAYEEVNLPYLEEHGFDLVRRETGGGTVYLDDRNMSYCFFIRPNNPNDLFGNFKLIYDPIVKVLKKMGVQGLDQEGRNDLTLDGKKVSGAAMTVVNGRIYAGYSLLLDPNYEVMDTVLRPNSKKIKSHGVKSVRSRIGSLRQALAPEYQDISVWDFSDKVLQELLGVTDLNQAKQYTLTEDDWAGIDQIARDRYNNWDWTYGHFGDFDYQVDERFEGVGTLHVGLKIKDATIDHIQITGDFFSVKNRTELEDRLQGVRLDKKALEEALSDMDLASYINKMDQDQFINFILEIPTS